MDKTIKLLPQTENQATMEETLKVNAGDPTIDCTDDVYILD